MIDGCRTYVAGVLLFLFLCAPASTAAQSSSDALLQVALRVDPCVAADPAEVDRLFRLELRTAAPATGSLQDTRITRVEITCVDNLVELRVHDPVTGKSLTRRIHLEATSKGRDRLLALAAMELLVASWIELEATPTPSVPPADPPPHPNARRQARTAVRGQLPTRRAANGKPTWTNRAAVFGAAVSDGGAVQRGLGIRFNRNHLSGYGWSADLLAHTVTQELTLGKATTSTMQGSAAAHIWRQLGALQLQLAAGARVGTVTIAGDPAGHDQVVGNRLTGMSCGPLIRGEATVALTDQLVLAAATEWGYHLLNIRGRVDGAAELSIDSSWFGGQVGLAWQW